MFYYSYANINCKAIRTPNENTYVYNLLNIRFSFQAIE